MKGLVSGVWFRDATGGRVLTLAWLLLALLLAGCGPAREESSGVELVFGSPEPAAGMTFELRFDPIMIRVAQIGEPATPSPLVIVPPIAGKFTWLSPRSGAFTPAEPLALDTRYRFSLQPGLKTADGRPVEAVLRRTLVTPPTSGWRGRKAATVSRPLSSRTARDGPLKARPRAS